MHAYSWGTAAFLIVAAAAVAALVARGLLTGRWDVPVTTGSFPLLAVCVAGAAVLVAAVWALFLMLALLGSEPRSGQPVDPDAPEE